MMLQDLGDRIRQRREKRGLKQIDVANALQVSHQAVSKWERGENAPDIAILAPLARLLGVSTDWLLAAGAEDLDTFDAAVLVSSVHGAYLKSRGLPPQDFAAWANGLFFQITQAVLRYDGVPIKYMGDQLLCFFSGADHANRAVQTALLARRIVAEELRVGLNCGKIYLGSVGHPDYARPDIMGETVNVAFLALNWAETKTKSGIAATQAVTRGIDPTLFAGKGTRMQFQGITHPVRLFEIRAAEKKVDRCGLDERNGLGGPGRKSA